MITAHITIKDHSIEERKEIKISDDKLKEFIISKISSNYDDSAMENDI